MHWWEARAAAEVEKRVVRLDVTGVEVEARGTLSGNRTEVWFQPDGGGERERIECADRLDYESPRWDETDGNDAVLLSLRDAIRKFEDRSLDAEDRVAAAVAVAGSLAQNCNMLDIDLDAVIPWNRSGQDW